MDSTSNRRKEEALLAARIEDVVEQASGRYYVAFLGFLDQSEQALAMRVLKGLRVDNYLFYGGYHDSERCLLGVFPDGEEPSGAIFPLRTVAFHYRSEKMLTHRDVLGTLMATGLRRDALGDILCTEGMSVVFLRDEICDYVCDQICKIGGESVRVEKDYQGELPQAHSFCEIFDTVASARLDAVVGALIRCSREQASQLIRTDAVSVDHIVAHSVTHQLRPGQTVSVRGYGRFIVDAIGPQTKKGRLRLSARKYI